MTAVPEAAGDSFIRDQLLTAIRSLDEQTTRALFLAGFDAPTLADAITGALAARKPDARTADMFACASCGRGIEGCAPCCRHGGWVHRHSGAHGCSEGETVASLDPTPDNPAA